VLLLLVVVMLLAVGRQVRGRQALHAASIKENL